jgi:mono/diheme cytochrome c family protein
MNWLIIQQIQMVNIDLAPPAGAFGADFRTWAREIGEKQVMGMAEKLQRANECAAASVLPRAWLGAMAGVFALGACAAALPEPTTADLALARADDPGISLDDLQRGRAVYGRRCGSCHALRSPGDRAPEAWPAEVNRMQREHAVRLTPEEEHDIVRYLRAASALARQNAPSK